MIREYSWLLFRSIEPKNVFFLLEVILTYDIKGMCSTFKTLLPDIPIKQGSAYKLPFEDSFADGVVCAQVNTVTNVDITYIVLVFFN